MRLFMTLLLAAGLTVNFENGTIGLGTAVYAFDDVNDWLGDCDDDYDDDDNGDWWDNDPDYIFELEEVVCEAEGNDPDWTSDWGYEFPDEPENNDYENGDEEYENEDGVVFVNGKNNSEIANSYKFQKADNLSLKKWILTSQIGFKQATDNTCVAAGMEFVARLFNISDVTEAKVVLSLLKTMGRKTIIGEFASKEKLEENLIKIANSYKLNAERIENIKEAIDSKAVVMTTEAVEAGSHDIIIVGYNKNGYIAYDTDRTAGVYINIPESAVNRMYCIGIKK